MNKPAAALKGYATAATTMFCGGDSEHTAGLSAELWFFPCINLYIICGARAH